MERVVFFGSPAFALPSLEALAASEFRPVLVVTQPDRPAGRGKKVTPTPVRELAEKKGIPVKILESFRERRRPGRASRGRSRFLRRRLVREDSARRRPSASRKRAISTSTPRCCPRYRGASPIIGAIVNGDSFTGRHDHGDGRGARFRSDLSADDRRASIRWRTRGGSRSGSRSRALRFSSRRCGGSRARGCGPSPQPEEGVVKAPLLRKEDGLIPWEHDALAVHNHIRGMNPWPGSFSWYRGAYLKIHEAEPRTSFRGRRRRAPFSRRRGTRSSSRAAGAP